MEETGAATGQTQDEQWLSDLHLGNFGVARAIVGYRFQARQIIVDDMQGAGMAIGVEIAVLFREEDKRNLRVSLRSKDRINIGAVAEYFHFDYFFRFLQVDFFFFYAFRKRPYQLRCRVLFVAALGQIHLPSLAVADQLVVFPQS